MKLTIGNQPVAIPRDAKISLEKSSPFLGNDATSFSYPFPIPRLPNQQVLGWPGKLERNGEISNKTFILEDQGIQVVAGEIEFDDIDDENIGVILKSGNTEFWSKIKNLKMADIDFGSETWLTNPTTFGAFDSKLQEWDADNIADNAPIIAVPFWLDNADKSEKVLGNGWQTVPYSPDIYFAYMRQFRAWYLIEKIFENFDYTIAADYLKTSEFSQLIVFTKPFYQRVMASEEDPTICFLDPVGELLIYSSRMPDMTVQDFMDHIKSITGIIFLIDDQNKRVTITLQRSLFETESIDLMSITELKGWIHREHESTDGYQLTYQSQDDENDTKIDYIINDTVADTLPTATTEGKIVHVTSVDRDYITLKKLSDSSLYWSQIGRLKPHIVGNGGLKIEFPVKVPPTDLVTWPFHPYLAIDITIKRGRSNNEWFLYNDMSELYVSLFRGYIDSMGGLLTCAEKWAPDATPSLVPADLFTSSHDDYLIWKSTNARKFTKYIQLDLPSLMALQWGKRYFIGGIRVVLEKINYELPWTGIVKVEGYTA